MIILFVVLGILWIVSFGLLLRKIIVSKARRHSGEWTRTQLMWQSLYHTRRQQLLAYWPLSIGVFTVFAVGLNRPDFTDAEMLGKATGGYDLYVESRVPIQYDLNVPEVRQKLSLTGLSEGTMFLSFLRHTEDEASCLNLNKVETPTVLGINMEKMMPFGVEQIKPFGFPKVYIDEEALIWSMMKSVGDTILYTNSKGEKIPVVIAGSYPTGIFHGNALMSEEDFRALWQEESGVEVLLVKSTKPDEASDLIATALSEYGITIQRTSERIEMFFEVTDTYLIIFLTLGAIGMLLGIFSLIIIIRKNLAANASTTELYLTLGFSKETVERMLVRENTIVPLLSILAGAVGSLVSILANATGAGMHAITMAMAWLALLLAAVYCGISVMVRKELK